MGETRRRADLSRGKEWHRAPDVLLHAVEAHARLVGQYMERFGYTGRHYRARDGERTVREDKGGGSLPANGGQW